MDAELVMRMVERAVRSLDLERALHPWWLDEPRPPRPVLRVPVLAAPCPLPYQLEPTLLLEAFAAGDRSIIVEQIDDAYRHLVVLPSAGDDAVATDEAEAVRVQLGMPLIGRDRVLIRICTRNLWGDAQVVTGDFHAWLTPDGVEMKTTSPAQQKLVAEWPRWVVGRSPGLRSAVDLNAATESELMQLPQINQKKARAIIAARPFASVEGLVTVRGIGRAGLENLRMLVTI